MGAENSTDALDAFDSLDAVSTPDVVDSDTSAKKEAKKAEIRKKQKVYTDTLKNDPTYLERHCKWSNSIQVVHSFGYTDKGNIVRNGKATKDDKGQLANTGAIIGYELRNTGNVPIPYNTEEYTKDDAGMWVGNKIQKTLEPGQSACLTRKYTAMLCAIPEISFKLANGIIMSGSGTPKDPTDMDKYLSSHYFKFSDPKFKVNSSDIKINVGQKIKTEDGSEGWEVKKEYEVPFGYLNNPETKSSKSGSNKVTASAQDVTSNYVRHLIESMGTM